TRRSDRWSSPPAHHHARATATPTPQASAQSSGAHASARSPNTPSSPTNGWSATGNETDHAPRRLDFHLFEDVREVNPPLFEDVREVNPPLFEDVREVNPPLFEDVREVNPPLVGWWEDCSVLFRRLVAHRVDRSCPGFSIPSGAVRRPDESGSL